jgi:hypothetical protein
MDADNCPYHERLRRLERTIADNGKDSLSDAERTQYTRLLEHVSLCKNQRQQYHAMKNSLRSGQVLVVLDFAKHVTALGRVTDLVVAVFHPSTGDVISAPRYYDFLMDDAPADSRFLRTVWDRLIELKAFGDSVKLGDIDLLVWNDGGPNHFRTKETLYDYTVRREQFKSLSYNLLAPHHGKNVCDGHVGATKMTEKRAHQKGRAP